MNVLHCNSKDIKLLAKHYSPLAYPSKLLQMLEVIYPLRKFETLTKYDLHCLLNDALISLHRGEQIHKYRLFQMHIGKKLVAAFEVKINNSRLDFLAIGSTTTSYEIKSEIDNLAKLTKQVSDYQLAFEYNYLIVDKSHSQNAFKLIPESFGLWSFENGKYNKIRNASLNRHIDPYAQLKLLNKKELMTFFPNSGCDQERIVELHSPGAINKQFKKALTERYKDRWGFLELHQKAILPIDIQFFFNTNIQPKFIYAQ
jgi:hypothetical protein